MRRACSSSKSSSSSSRAVVVPSPTQKVSHHIPDGETTSRTCGTCPSSRWSLRHLSRPSSESAPRFSLSLSLRGGTSGSKTTSPEKSSLPNGFRRTRRRRLRTNVCHELETKEKKKRKKGGAFSRVLLFRVLNIFFVVSTNSTSLFPDAFQRPKRQTLQNFFLAA